MSIVIRAALTATLAAGLAPSLASAKPLRRHAAHARHHFYSYAPRHEAPRYGYAQPEGYDRRYGAAYGPTSADPYPLTEADNPYSPYAAPGAAIRALARRNQYAPGVTNELAPDNIATATGGPSGGVPGFSGH